MIIASNCTHLDRKGVDKSLFCSQQKELIFHNAKAKIYPDGTQKITVCSRAIFKEDGWELNEPKEFVPKPKNMSNPVRNDNIKRAKETVFDISLLNHYTHFITWTLDKNEIDRYDSQEVSKKLKKFLNNMQQRYDLMAIILPELHKDGAIHMHGLISGNLRFVDSDTRLIEGHKKPVHKSKDKKGDGKVVYNMPQWKYGHSTAIELTGESINIAKYITKYVSKDFRKIFGSFYYACGKGLKRKPPVKLYDTNYFEINSKEYSVPEANLGFKYVTVEEEVKNDDTTGIAGVPDRPTDKGKFTEDNGILSGFTDNVFKDSTKTNRIDYNTRFKAVQPVFNE